MSEQSSGPEPGCREAYPWGQPWAADLRSYLSDLAALRQDQPSLCDGSMQWESRGDDGLLGRSGSVQVWINRSRNQDLPINLSDAQTRVFWSSGSPLSPSGAVGTQSAVLLMSDEALDEN